MIPGIEFFQQKKNVMGFVTLLQKFIVKEFWEPSPCPLPFGKGRGFFCYQCLWRTETHVFSKCKKGEGSFSDQCPWRTVNHVFGLYNYWRGFLLNDSRYRILPTTENCHKFCDTPSKSSLLKNFVNPHPALSLLSKGEGS